MEYTSQQRFQRIEGCFDPGGQLPPERLAWLLTHEKEIHGLLEAPKAEHFSRYSIRRLRLD